jgi:TatA/E family protein of Tat protein translocase
MFAGLASPSHLIIVLVLVLLLFGAKRIPELAKGLGTGVKELREGISTGDRPNPWPRTMRKLAEALGVSVADIRKRD